MRLLRAVIFYLFAWILGVVFYKNLYAVLMQIWSVQIHQVLLADIRFGVLLPWYIASAFALWVSVPFWVFEMVCFISPALYDREKVKLNLVASMATGLFILGSVLGLWQVLPMLLTFARQLLPHDVLFLPSMDALIVLSFQVAMMGGLVFEVPLVIYVLLKNEWVKAHWLRKNRSIWVSGIFFVAMLLTPPDVISQLIMALPLWLSIELVLVLHDGAREKSIDILD
ncbi:twin-arginine translocase subunit TatC [Gammaproteobacteria bacterium]|nr:twin-arginine translocase subunit TatC [Gammaproteobacteria bacterium]